MYGGCFVVVCVSWLLLESSSASKGLSPRITNIGALCKEDKCLNKFEFYKRYDSVNLEVTFSGGPCNVTWLFNYTHLLKETVAVQDYDHYMLNIGGEDPEKQEGYYVALVSNSFGSNSSITYMEYRCISAGDVYNQDFNTTTISKTVGDMLTINFDVSGKINLLICFSQNLSNSFTLNENDCVKCSANHRYHQCVNYEGFPTVNFQSFQITFDHSLCTLDYHLTIFKHHLTIADNGTLIFAEYNGEIYKTFKNVELLVNNHSYDYVYGTLTIAIAIILSIVLFVICQKMKKISKSRGVIRQTLRNIPQPHDVSPYQDGQHSTIGTLEPPSNCHVNLQGSESGRDV